MNASRCIAHKNDIHDFLEGSVVGSWLSDSNDLTKILQLPISFQSKFCLVYNQLLKSLIWR